MISRTKACLLALALWAAVAPTAGAEWVWRSDTGWVNTGGRQPLTVDAVLRYASAQMALGNYAAALERLNGLRGRPLARAEQRDIDLGTAECLAHLGRFAEAADITENITGKLDAPAILRRDAIRQYMAVSKAKETLAVSKRVLDNMLGYTRGGAPRIGWTQQDLMAVAEAYGGLREYSRALDTAQRFRVAFPTSPLTTRSLRFSAEMRALSAAETNAAGELPRVAAGDFEAYLKTHPKGSDTGPVKEQIAILERVAKERSPEMRMVLYGALRLELGEADLAYEKLDAIAEQHPHTPAGEAAAYYRALALEAMGQFPKSARACTTFIETYPNSAYYERVTLLAFRLSRDMLRGGEDSVAAIDAAYARDPKGPLADDALMAKGRYMMVEKRYPEAVRLFRSVLEDYGASESAAEALFRLGEATLSQAEYHPQRQAIYRRAREAFELYLKRYPHGKYAKAALANAQRCRGEEVAHLYNVAEFYLKQGKPQSANVYLRIIERDYPNTPRPVIERKLGQ